MNTGYRNPNKVRIVTIDTKTRFNKTGDIDCSFDAFFSSALNISKDTNVYLSNLFIGGYKICPKPAYYDASGNGDIISAFIIKIPDLEMITIGADASGNIDNMNTIMNKTSVLILESPSIISTTDAAKPSDYKPFILGHLSKTAVYLAKVGPKKLNSLNVTITDQDGDKIWKAKNGHGSDVDSNPPSGSRRVIMQLMFVEE
tara:strand:- start:407 stop:1009 length:603 start_codon:yes stop_codon:yes gene_type:complete